MTELTDEKIKIDKADFDKSKVVLQAITSNITRTEDSIMKFIASGVENEYKSFIGNTIRSLILPRLQQVVQNNIIELRGTTFSDEKFSLWMTNFIKAIEVEYGLDEVQKDMLEDTLDNGTSYLMVGFKKDISSEKKGNKLKLTVLRQEDVYIQEGVSTLYKTSSSGKFAEYFGYKRRVTGQYILDLAKAERGDDKFKDFADGDLQKFTIDSQGQQQDSQPKYYIIEWFTYDYEDRMYKSYLTNEAFDFVFKSTYGDYSNEKLRFVELKLFKENNKRIDGLNLNSLFFINNGLINQLYTQYISDAKTSRPFNIFPEGTQPEEVTDYYSTKANESLSIIKKDKTDVLPLEVVVPQPQSADKINFAGQLKAQSEQATHSDTIARGNGLGRTATAFDVNSAQQNISINFSQYVQLLYRFKVITLGYILNSSIKEEEYYQKFLTVNNLIGNEIYKQQFNTYFNELNSSKESIKFISDDENRAAKNEKASSYLNALQILQPVNPNINVDYVSNSILNNLGIQEENFLKQSNETRLATALLTNLLNGKSTPLSDPSITVDILKRMLDILSTLTPTNKKSGISKRKRLGDLLNAQINLLLFSQQQQAQQQGAQQPAIPQTNVLPANQGNNTNNLSNT